MYLCNLKKMFKVSRFESLNDTDAFTAYGVYLQDGSGKALV